MEVVPGGNKLCTRRNFNSNVDSYFTNDDKVLTRNEIGVSFTVGNYDYTVYSEVKDLNICMSCENIKYNKRYNKIDYSISFENGICDPDRFGRYDYNWEEQGGGDVYLYDTIKIVGYSSSGDIVLDTNVSAKIYGQIDGTEVIISDVIINDGSFLFFSVPNTTSCQKLEAHTINIRPIGGISGNSTYYLNGSTSGTWPKMTFVLT